MYCSAVRQSSILVIVIIINIVIGKDFVKVSIKIPVLPGIIFFYDLNSYISLVIDKLYLLLL